MNNMIFWDVVLQNKDGMEALTLQVVVHSLNKSECMYCCLKLLWNKGMGSLLVLAKYFVAKPKQVAYPYNRI